MICHTRGEPPRYLGSFPACKFNIPYLARLKKLGLKIWGKPAEIIKSNFLFFINWISFLLFKFFINFIFFLSNFKMSLSRYF